MESWTTTTSLPLSAAKEHNDRGRPDVGVPADQSGVWNGESSEAASPTIASLVYEPVSDRWAQKGVKRGNF